jgi:hypothetical protein
MTDKRTVAQWAHYLEAPGVELTLSEFMALCLMHIRENVKDARLGTEHLEGMVGSLDEFMAAANPVYRSLAERSRPAPVLGGPREPAM